MKKAPAVTLSEFSFVNILTPARFIPHQPFNECFREFLLQVNDHKYRQLAEGSLLVLLLHISKRSSLLNSAFLYFNLVTKIGTVNKRIYNIANILIYHQPIFCGNPYLTSYKSLCLFINHLPLLENIRSSFAHFLRGKSFSSVVCLDLSSVNLGFMDELIYETPFWLLNVFSQLPRLTTLKLGQNSISGMIDSKVVHYLVDPPNLINNELKKRSFELRCLSVPGLDIRTELLVPFISLFPKLEGLDISSCPCITTPALKGCVSALPLLNYLNISFCPNLTGDITDFLVPPPGYSASQQDSPRILRQIVSAGNPRFNAYFEPPAYSEF